MYLDPVLINGHLCRCIHGARRRTVIGNWKYTTKAVIWVSVCYARLMTARVPIEILTREKKETEIHSKEKLENN